MKILIFFKIVLEIQIGSNITKRYRRDLKKKHTIEESEVYEKIVWLQIVTS